MFLVILWWGLYLHWLNSPCMDYFGTFVVIYMRIQNIDNRWCCNKTVMFDMKGKPLRLLYQSGRFDGGYKQPTPVVQRHISKQRIHCQCCHGSHAWLVLMSSNLHIYSSSIISKASTTLTLLGCSYSLSVDVRAAAQTGCQFSVDALKS